MIKMSPTRYRILLPLVPVLIYLAISVIFYQFSAGLPIILQCLLLGIAIIVSLTVSWKNKFLFLFVVPALTFLSILPGLYFGGVWPYVTGLMGFIFVNYKVIKKV